MIAYDFTEGYYQRLMIQEESIVDSFNNTKKDSSEYNDYNLL